MIEKKKESKRDNRKNYEQSSGTYLGRLVISHGIRHY